MGWLVHPPIPRRESGRHTRSRVVPSSIASPFDPAAGEARAAESTNDVRVLLHELPQESGAMILDHRHDGALIDPDVVVIEPAFAGNNAAAKQADCRIL